MVRIVARAFYLYATGIAYEQEASEVPALQRWAKFGGESLSRIVDKMPFHKQFQVLHYDVVWAQ